MEGTSKLSKVTLVTHSASATKRLLDLGFGCGKWLVHHGELNSNDDTLFLSAERINVV